MVRQALPSAIPPERKKSAHDCPKLGRVREFIDRVLEADRQTPRKQCHTTHRIWVRLKSEWPEHPIGEATMRRYVSRRKRELGLNGRQVCVPQSYAPGQEAQVDWWTGSRPMR